MTARICPQCGTVLLPEYTVCPFCHASVHVAPAPPAAPSPSIAPSPEQYCPKCQIGLRKGEPLIIPRAPMPPRLLEAYVCPKCGRVELYERRNR